MSETVEQHAARRPGGPAALLLSLQREGEAMSGEPQTAGGKEMKSRVEARTRKRVAGKRHVWCCYDKPLGEKFVLFGAELDALRYAAENTMFCRAVEYGVPIQEQLSGGVYK